jgi:hypothetical protein
LLVISLERRQVYELCVANECNHETLFLLQVH